MQGRVVDLSVPVANHFRWAVERKLRGDFARGDDFQITWVGWSVHGFTHMDAPRHMVPGGATTSDIALDRLIGDAAILDLTAVADDTEIGREHVAAAGAHLAPGDIALLRTDWDQRASLDAPEFWTRAPYMSRAACEWLLARRIKAVGFDFPQDRPIRGLLTGEHAPLAEFVTHDVLLRNGVVMLEYLCNLGALAGPRTQLVALPLKIPDADGAPTRVIAIEPA